MRLGARPARATLRKTKKRKKRCFCPVKKSTERNLELKEKNEKKKSKIKTFYFPLPLIHHNGYYMHYPNDLSPSGKPLYGALIILTNAPTGQDF